MPTISAIIIAKNEARDIQACIKSVLWMDEIIVVDNGSTDETQNICKKYTPKLQFFSTDDWPGFGKQKNRALALANSDWVFSLDADEIVTPELHQEIIISTKSNNFNSYKIPRSNYFLGREMKYCLNKKDDAPIRLFKKNHGKFSDDLIHERILIDGNIGCLQHHLLHYPFYDLEELMEKCNSYSSLGAKKLFTKKVKPSISKAIFHSLWIFIRLYILKKGILDGWPGFLIALSGAEGTFYKYAKLRELL